MIRKMQKVDWLIRHVMLVLDDESPVASPDIAIQSRGTAWYEEAKSQGKHLVVSGCAYVDPDTQRIRITIYKPGFGTRQVLAEEIYHVGLKILCYESPRLFAAIRRWYRSQLANGTDPTFSLADRFASMMAAEETGARTSLPPGVVSAVRKLLGPTANVSASVMQRVVAHWSEALPVCSRHPSAHRSQPLTKGDPMHSIGESARGPPQEVASQYRSQMKQNRLTTSPCERKPL
jgi:hypothetical protein